MVNKNKLRGRMIEKGETYESLAKKLNITKNTLYNKANGISSFTTDEAEMICDILHITDNNDKCDIF